MIPYPCALCNYDSYRKYIIFTLSKWIIILRTRVTINKKKNMRTLTNSLYTQAVDPLNCWTLPVVCRAAAFSLEAVITDASVTPEETVSQEPKLLTADQQWSILHLQAWLGLHTHWFMVRVVHPRAAKSSGQSRFSVRAQMKEVLWRTWPWWYRDSEWEPDTV